MVGGLFLALAAGSAAAQDQAPSILSVLAGYLPFAGVAFFFGGIRHLARVIRRSGTPIDPRTLLLRSVIGTAAGIFSLWGLEASSEGASPQLRFLVTATGAILGEAIFRAAERRALGAEGGEA